ncbi:hypothetical protein D3C87_1975600 [compost metagenome]
MLQILFEDLVAIADEIIPPAEIGDDVDVARRGAKLPQFGEDLALVTHGHSEHQATP